MRARESVDADKTNSGTIGDPTPVRALLASHRATIDRLARTSNLRNVRVFGSVARGDDGPESDIDLLVDPEPGATYFDFARFALDVERLIDRQVDVISRNALNAERHARILMEATEL